MRFSTLVLATFLGILALSAVTPAQKGNRFDYQVTRVDDLTAGHLKKTDGESGDDPVNPYLMGRVTDFSGRSIRGAEIVLFSLDSDAVKHVRTNSFGYYRFRDLEPGKSYLISVLHRKYLFVMGSVSFIVEDSPIQIDFQAEERP